MVIFQIAALDVPGRRCWHHPRPWAQGAGPQVRWIGLRENQRLKPRFLPLIYGGFRERDTPQSSILVGFCMGYPHL